MSVPISVAPVSLVSLAKVFRRVEESSGVHAVLVLPESGCVALKFVESAMNSLREAGVEFRVFCLGGETGPGVEGLPPGDPSTALESALKGREPSDPQRVLKVLQGSLEKLSFFHQLRENLFTSMRGGSFGAGSAIARFFLVSKSTFEQRQTRLDFEAACEGLEAKTLESVQAVSAAAERLSSRECRQLREARLAELGAELLVLEEGARSLGADAEARAAGLRRGVKKFENFCGRVQRVFEDFLTREQFFFFDFDAGQNFKNLSVAFSKGTITLGSQNYFSSTISQRGERISLSFAIRPFFQIENLKITKVAVKGNFALFHGDKFLVSFPPDCPNMAIDRSFIYSKKTHGLRLNSHVVVPVSKAPSEISTPIDLTDIVKNEEELRFVLHVVSAGEVSLEIKFEFS